MTDESGPSNGSSEIRPTSFLSSPGIRFGGAALLAFALLIGAYSNHFDNSFHFDDSHSIVRNIYLRDLGNIPKFFQDPLTFTSRPENATYRPLLSVSFALDYWLGDGLDSTRQFHITQFGLHVLLGVLLFFFFRRLADLGRPSADNRYFALFAALLFCIHTANTQTVNYISSRSSLLATLGVVAAYLVYLRWPGGRRFGAYLFPVVLFAFAKPLTIMFAPILMVGIYLFQEERSFYDLFHSKHWRAILSVTFRSLPAFITSAALYIFLSRMDSDTLVLAQTKPLDYLITQPFVWLHYFRLFVLPTGLTADTDWEILRHWWDTRVFAGALFIAALCWVGFRCSKTKELRPAAFGILWFVIALIPTSSIIPLSEVYNEHRIFFPYVGLTFSVVWILRCGIDRLEKSTLVSRKALNRGVAFAALALLLAHGAGTYERNKVWLTEESLWEDVTIKSPRNGRALMNYGLSQMRRGNLEKALEYFKRARRLNPNYAHLEVNLAIVHAALGKDEAAEPYFKRALSLQPNFVAGNFFYARWLSRQKRIPEAEDHLKRALSASPSHTESRALLTKIYAVRQSRDALESLASETLRINPNDPVALAYSQGKIPFSVSEQTAEAYAALGRSRLDQENFLDAAAIYRYTLRLPPPSAELAASYWNNLGWALMNLGLYDESIPCFVLALELDPTLALARNNLEWAEREHSSKNN